MSRQHVPVTKLVAQATMEAHAGRHPQVAPSGLARAHSYELQLLRSTMLQVDRAEKEEENGRKVR